MIAVFRRRSRSITAGHRHLERRSVGIAGATIVSVATVAASLASHWCQERVVAAGEKLNKYLFLSLLNKPKYQWGELDTLMHFIGSDEATTKRLLLEIGARATSPGPSSGQVYVQVLMLSFFTANCAM